jgi:hypothetical protein
MEDQIRFFLEETDSFQGYNIFADSFNGFSGVTYSIVQDLLDMNPKSTIHLYGLSPFEEYDSHQVQFVFPTFIETNTT